MQEAGILANDAAARKVISAIAVTNDKSEIMSVGRCLENPYGVYRLVRLEEDIERQSVLGSFRVKATTSIVHEVNNHSALALGDPTGSTGKAPEKQ